MPMPITALSSDNHTATSSVGVLCPRDGGVRVYRARCAGADAPPELATFDGEAVVCALHQFCATVPPVPGVAEAECALEPPSPIRLDAPDGSRGARSRTGR